MSTRQFFVWSFWAIAAVFALPLLAWLAGPLLGQLPTTSSGTFLVIAPGEFPDTYSITREDLPWRIYPDIPQTSSASYHRIIVNRDGPPEDQQWGHIVTVSYANAETADRAYEAIRSEAEFARTAQPLPFGERGSQTRPTYRYNGSDILFQRCGVIAHVAMEYDALDQLLVYARRLDERIAAAKCKQ